VEKKMKIIAQGHYNFIGPEEDDTVQTGVIKIKSELCNFFCEDVKTIIEEVKAKGDITLVRILSEKETVINHFKIGWVFN
jgi:hypothetical protein